jgi:hypothetical protein
VTSQDITDTCAPRDGGAGVFLFVLVVAFRVDFVFLEDQSVCINHDGVGVFDERDDLSAFVGQVRSPASVCASVTHFGSVYTTTLSLGAKSRHAAHIDG